MHLCVDMEYGLRLGQQLQIFQHVLLFLLLLKLLQLGLPFLFTDVQQVLDLLLGIGVFQDQEIGKGVRVDEFLFTGGKTDGDHISVPICNDAFSEGNVFDWLSDQLHRVRSFLAEAP